MKLQQLRFFQAACKYNSITRAARELHISQPPADYALHGGRWHKADAPEAH